MTHEERLLFGERLRGRRETLGLTQEDVAGKTGISLRFYQMIERGEKSVSLETLVHLRSVLSSSLDYLLLGELTGAVSDPLSEALGGLTPWQREDAIRILLLYAKACK